MKNLPLLPFLMMFTCLFQSCSTNRTNINSNSVRDTLGVGFNTSGINRSIPPPVGQNHPQGSVGLGSKDMQGTAAITELNQDKILKDKLSTPEQVEINPVDWESGSITVHKFIPYAYQEGLQSIVMGNLALENAADGKVKDLAKLVINDYTLANKELERIAKERNIKLGENSESPENLLDMKGEAFENQYINQVLNNQKESIALYEKASTSSDAEVKSFSERRLPQLKKNLSAAVALKE